MTSPSVGVAVVRGTRHPATALLFTEWVLTEGQDLYVEVGRDAPRRDLAVTRGLEQEVIDVFELADGKREWLGRYERLLRLGRQHAD